MRATVSILLIAASALLAWSEDPFVGSWKLDMEKSSTAKGKASETRTITFMAIPHGYQGTSQIGSGPAASGEMILDGKEREAPQSRIVTNTGATSAIATRISDHAFSIRYLRGGETVATNRTEVSRDGKTLTMTSDGKYSDGTKLHNVFVYVRQ